jgi:hypothetical protein
LVLNSMPETASAPTCVRYVAGLIQRGAAQIYTTCFRSDEHARPRADQALKARLSLKRQVQSGKFVSCKKTANFPPKRRV